MTLQETRQMEIEFERRVQTILPATEFQAKLDTETIESFLNQYQIQYVQGIINTSATPEELPEQVKSKIDSILSLLVKHTRLAIGSADREDPSVDVLPEDFLSYLYSTTNVWSTYKGNTTTEHKVRNKYVSPSEFAKLVQVNPFDQMRILRQPIVSIFDKKVVRDGSTEYILKVLHTIYDNYTIPSGVDLYYYKMPAAFSILNSTVCELPIDCFDDLVSGAVNLYMQYVRGGIRQQEEDGRRERAQRRAEDREAERNRKQNKEEQQ